MCGVIGYIGREKKNLSGFLLQELKKLEYRGYDSSGIAIVANNKIRIIKAVGEIKNLEKKLRGRKIKGSVGLGHTRWATHGGVTTANAHPHTDCSGNIAVVHNGIIENYEILKKDLIRKGHVFKSGTDSEVIPHLIEDIIKNSKGDIQFVEVVRKTFNSLQGLNAFVAVNGKGQMVAFRQGSPLVAGYDENGSYISSDIPTLSLLTDKIVIVEDGSGLLLDGKAIYSINTRNGNTRKMKGQLFTYKAVESDKGKFKHFMQKEIIEEAEVVSRIAGSDENEIKQIADLIKKSVGTYFTACGTASYSGIAATYMFAEIAKRHVNFCVGSEFPYFEDFLLKESLLIAASQSGETMDTLEAVRAAKRHGSKVLALVNVAGSSLSRMADKTYLLKAGPEMAVVSTKAYVAKLATFLLLAYSVAGKYTDGVKLLTKTAKIINEMLSEPFDNQIKDLAKRIIKNEHLYVIGRGVNYATALEGALKLTEASYIHAQGFAGGELKHGVIALITKGTPCIVIVANDNARESVLSNAMELKSRGGYIIGVAAREEEVFDYFIKVPDVGNASPIVSVIPFQLLAYRIAIMKGINPDRPRNLAKSVTVK